MKKIKSVFILGASSDIGLSIMKIYQKNNYKILAHYNKGNKIFFEYVQRENIKTIKFNFLTSNKNISKFAKRKDFKNYDILINASAHIKEISFKNVKIEDLEQNFKVNFYPYILLMQNIGFQMNKKKWGRIVNLGSIGVKFGGGLKNFPYALSKFILEFFPSQTKDWVKNNVLINTIRVGATKTKIHYKLPSKNLKEREKLIPMQRFATTEEIAEYVFYLGSNSNTYISNQVLSISGGE
jgi:3-oxoacyl-[acyl-carrier protein] reductase